MNRLRVALLVLAGGLAAMPAQAAGIGVRGGDFDPPLITDITFYPLESCPGVFDLPEDYSCALYDFADFTDIFSLDFRLIDPFGDYVHFSDGLLFVDVAFSDLTLDLIPSPLFDDDVTFRLDGDEEELIFHCGEECFPAIAFFMAPEGEGEGEGGGEGFGLLTPGLFNVSIVAVNHIANPGATAVPEPATLLLFGSAGLALARRRRA